MKKAKAAPVATKKELAPPTTAPDMKKDGSHDDWEAKHAMDDMIRAEAHKENAELMARVHKIAGRHAKALDGIRSIKDLNTALNTKFGPKKKDA